MSKVSRAVNHILKASILVNEDSNRSIYSKTVDRYRDEVIPGLEELASGLSKLLGCDIEIAVSGDFAPSKRSLCAEGGSVRIEPDYAPCAASSTSAPIGKFRKAKEVEARKLEKKRKRAASVETSELRSDVAELMASVRDMSRMISESNAKISDLEKKVGRASARKSAKRKAPVKIDVASMCTPIEEHTTKMKPANVVNAASQTNDAGSDPSVDAPCKVESEKSSRKSSRKSNRQRRMEKFNLTRYDYSDSQVKEFKDGLRFVKDMLRDNDLLFACISCWFSMRYVSSPSLDEYGKLRYALAYAPGWIINIILKYTSLKDDDSARDAFLEDLYAWSENADSSVRYGVPKHLQNKKIDDESIIGGEFVDDAFYLWSRFVDKFNFIEESLGNGVRLHRHQFPLHLLSLDKNVSDDQIERYMRLCSEAIDEDKVR